MTGTAKTQLTEFEETYKIGVVEIPTNRPMIRADEQDLDLQDRGREVERGRRRHPRAQRDGSADPRRHGLDREVRAALGHPQPPRHRAQRAEREEPREGSDDRGPGRPQGRRHRRHEHGRARRRHPAGRQPRVPGAAGDGRERLRQRPLPALRDGRGGTRRLRGRLRADLPEAQGADRRRARRGRRAGRSLRAGHRATRVAAHRQPAARPLRAARATRARRSSTSRSRTT